MQLTCIDANTPYCPCLLAETNHCIVCSHLQGKNFCDCHWSGVCILNEKHWQSNLKVTEDMIFRREEEGKILHSELIGDHTYQLTVQVSEELAEQLTPVGAFVFLRMPQDPPLFYFPVGIMSRTEREIQLVIDQVGTKSSRLVIENGRNLLVRGPYFNGVFGRPWIDKISCGTILVIAGGIGQAPAFSIATQLVRQKNRVIVWLAPGGVGSIFIADELTKLGAEFRRFSSLRQEGFPELADWFMGEQELPDLVVSAGPDEQHRAVVQTMTEAHLNLPFAATNNAIMCCGEGICGSCQAETKDRQKICTCKTQIDFMDLLPKANEE